MPLDGPFGRRARWVGVSPAALVGGTLEVSHLGATWYVSGSNLTLRESVTGYPLVYAPDGASITNVTPASEDINADGHAGNGIMKDPYIKSTGTQGFDSYIGAGVARASSNTTYDESLNIHPSVTGEPITIAPGESASFVMAKRLLSVTDPDEWQAIEAYPTLTVLSSDPGENAFRPSASGTTKTIYTTDAVDLTVFRSLTLDASFGKTLEQTAALIASDLGMYGAESEQTLRRFKLDAALGLSPGNYSAQLSDAYADALFILHSNAYTDAQKQDLLYKLIEFAIHLEGLHDRGWRVRAEVGAGAGQCGIPWSIFTYGAFVLGSATMLAKVAANNGPPDMCFWPDESYVGIATPGKVTTNAQTFFDENVGEPFCIPDELGSNFDTRYGVIGGLLAANEMLAVLALQNGPDGETGASFRLAGGADDATNVKAAALAFLDKYRQQTPDVMVGYGTSDRWSDLYDLIMAQPGIGHTAWTGRPQQLPLGTEAAYDGGDGDLFTGGDGQISWDYSAFGFATEPVTSFDVRYSLDGVQWIESIGAGSSGSITSLLKGTAHYCGARKVSASGAGLWSPNYPRTNDGASDRSVITTTGTPTATAPSFTTNPVIHAKTHPNWEHEPGNWYPVSGTLADNEVELICGLGYYDGEEEATPEFVWKRGGSPISGATSQGYTRVAADAGAELTCTITITNSAGSTSYTTAGVTCPAIPALPAGTLIDTDFKWPFVINYEDELAAAVLTNATAEHEPTFAYAGNEDEGYEALEFDTGGLLMQKTSSHPIMTLPFKETATAGATYNVAAEIVFDPAFYRGNYPANFGAVSIRNAAGTVVNTLGEVTLPEGDDLAPFVYNFEDTVVVDGAETDLDFSIRLRVVNSTGGTGYGATAELDGPYITSLSVVDASPGITLTELTEVESTANASSYSGLAPGFTADHAEKPVAVIVHVNSPSAGRVPTAVTAGGVSLTKQVGSATGTDVDSSASIWTGTLGSGTPTDEITLTFSNTETAVRCHTFVLDGASVTATDTAETIAQETGGTGITMSIDTPENGVLILAAATGDQTGGVTFSGAAAITSVDESSLEAAYWHTTAYRDDGTARTAETITGTGVNTRFHQIVGASFAPA